MTAPVSEGARLKVLIWATHLQADILALASYLDASPDIDLWIVTVEIDAFLNDPFAKIRPLHCPMLDRDDPNLRARLDSFAADVAVADNHLPPKGSAKKLAYIFHGHGWKDRGKLDLWTLFRGVEQLTGVDPRSPNPNFRAFCYGTPDRDWRAKEWSLHPDCLTITGKAFSDLLLAPPYDRKDLAPLYAIDVLARKTVLFCITWHYGGLFAQESGWRHWLRRVLRRDMPRDRDFAFVEHLAKELDALGANLLLCMHERRRFPPSFVQELERILLPFAHVQIKFKNEHPDNLADLVVADAMISNYSSYLTHFYLFGRPAIHVRPVESEDARFRFSMMALGRLHSRGTSKENGAWMLSLDDTGGPIVATAEEAVAEIRRALKEPEKYREATTAWLSRHLYGANGRSAERIKNALMEFCGVGAAKP